MTDTYHDTLTEIARMLGEAESVLFVTGAGISADSGLPTYRGVGGLYSSGATEDGVTIEEALSGPMFARQPALTWKYLWQIGLACRGAVPNPAHKIIAAIEAAKLNVWVVTQNVDGLHRAAGTHNLVEVHGNIHDLACTRCGTEYSAEELLSQAGDSPDLPPLCQACQGILRPQVVLFEELLPEHVVRMLMELYQEAFDLVIAVGTTAVFPYIREPILQAQLQNIPTVEINPTVTSLSHLVRYRLEMGAAAALLQLWHGQE